MASLSSALPKHRASLLLASLTCGAAVAVVAAAILGSGASPGWALGFAALLAGTVGVLLLTSPRTVALALVVPPLVVLFGAAIGLAWSGYPELSDQMLLSRGAAVALALVMLAAFCTLRPLGYLLGGLALLALVLPAALLLTAGAPGNPFVIILLLAGVAAIGGAIWSWQPLDRVWAWLAAAAVPQTLAGSDIPTIARTLGLLDSWIDPLGQIDDALGSIAAAPPAERRTAFGALIETLRHETLVLPEAARSQLAAAAAARPEIYLALAEDAYARREPDAAAGHLTQLQRALIAEPDLAWAADAARDLLTPDQSRITDSHQLTATVLAGQLLNSSDGGRPAALTSLLDAQGALPLEADLRTALEAAGRGDTQLVLAEDDARAGDLVGALLRLGGLLRAETTPPWLLDMALQRWDQQRDAPASAQMRLVEAIADARRHDDALAALALMAIEPGLAPQTAAMLAPLRADQGVAFVLGCDSVRRGGAGGALPDLVDGLDRLNPEVVARRVMPQVRAAAVAELDPLSLFHARPERPQVAESLARPLTSLASERATVWLWQTPAGAPERLAVIGAPPSRVAQQVDAAVASLAIARDNPDDLVLSDARFFALDATAADGHPDSGAIERLVLRAHRLVAHHGVGSLLVETLGDAERRTAIGQSLLRAWRAPLGQTLADLEQIEGRSGFVAWRSVASATAQGAERALDRGLRPATDESFPILTPYQQSGSRLRLRLPTRWIGMDGYERAADAYRLAMLDGLQVELERARQSQRAWVGRYSSQYHRLTGVQRRDGAAGLARQSFAPLFAIDPQTMTLRRMRSPQPMSGAAYLALLPLLITDRALALAATETELERLPQADGWRPHWEATLLVDGLLRGVAPPLADAAFQAVWAEWSAAWRPLALLALNRALGRYDLTIARVAVEQTVFRVLTLGPRTIEIELLHIFDPRYDQGPQLMERVTIFSPVAPERHRSTAPAEQAQEQARAAIADALERNALSPELLTVLGMDSGAAIDALLAPVVDALGAPELDKGIAGVLRDMGAQTDPVAVFIDARRDQQSVLTIAEACGDEGRRPGAQIDFLAYELYLLGEALRTMADGVQGGDASQPLLPAGAAVELAQLTGWQIIDQLLRDGQLAPAIAALLIQTGGGTWIGRAKQTFLLLSGQSQSYADECLASDGPPPFSPIRQTNGGAGALRGWRRVCYAIAEGDAALGFARGLEQGGDAAIAFARSRDILPTFALLKARRDRLVAASQRDGVGETPLQTAALLRQAIRDSVAHAESCYEDAAINDTRYGVGWLRLAQLKWWAGEYRAALDALIGSPDTSIEACRLPLTVAVRAAGGQLQVETGNAEWRGPAQVSVALALYGNTLSMTFRDGGARVGSCTIAGLGAADAATISGLFQQHRPAALASAGELSFENWLRLVQTPAIGVRRLIAGALQDDGEFAALVAMVRLRPPRAFIHPAIGYAARPPGWMTHDVVTAVG